MKFTNLAVGLTAATIAAGAAQAEMRLSLGVPDAHPFYQPLVEFGEALEAAGVETSVFSLQVLSAAEAASGVRDGLVDGAMVVMPYFANEFSEANLTSELSMLATSGTPAEYSGAAMEGPTMEYIMLNCPECQEQFKAQNQVYVSGVSSSDYTLVCNKPISTVADLQGARIRSGAGNYTRIAEAMGASVVSLKGAEVFDALSHGVVDCTMQPAASIIDFRFIEVASSVLIGYPGGVFSGIALPSINRDSWQSLTLEQRAAALKAVAKTSAEGFFNNITLDESALAEAREKGMQVFEADAELKERIASFVEADLETIREEQTNQFGIQNVDEKIAQIRELIEKWKGLTNEPGMDSTKLADLYWTEIFSKVDPATYGVD